MKTKLKIFLASLLCLSAGLSQAGPNEDLFAACQVGDVAKATAAINAGANVNFLSSGNSPLAVSFFWPEITKLLLEKGADPNLGAFPPLVQAVIYYSPEVMKLLLDAGADPDKPALIDPGATYKTMIANEKAKGKSANKAMIKAWEDAMAVVKPVQMYPLHTAVYTTSCTPCVELLLAKGAKLDGGVVDGTMLHVFGASSGKSKEGWKQTQAAIVTSIAPYGYSKIPAWYSPDMSEDRFGSADKMLKLLLAKGLNINEKNKGLDGLKPRGPLEIALNTGFGNVKEVMLALIDNGADPKVESEGFGPAIFQACQTGFVDVVKAMIEKGADINTEGSFFGQTEGVMLKGYTPLSIAALKDNTELVKYLIGAGAKTDIGVEGRYFNQKTGCVTKVSDKTAIYYAIENGNVDMVSFMVDADVKWWKRLKIHQIKDRSISQGINGIGQAVTIYSTSCFDAGEYLPSMYVNAISGNKKITAKKSSDQPAGLTQEQKEGLGELKKKMKAKGI